MTPDEAGAALAADPTFPLMNEGERTAEAAALLGGFATPCDDPLEIALAIEAAETLTAAASAAAVPVASVPGIEPCRLNGLQGASCGGKEPVAGNGRCMTCGAQRIAPTAPLESETAAEAITPAKSPDRAPAAPRPRNKTDLGASFIGRFKESTGCNDREVSELLGIARTTAQAYATKRLAEKLNVKQVRRMIAEIEMRQILMAELARDLNAAVGLLD
jgi:hypothetical protein